MLAMFTLCAPRMVPILPDDAGDVVVFEHENHPAGRRLDGIAVDAHDPWLVSRAKKGAAEGDSCRSPLQTATCSHSLKSVCSVDLTSSTAMPASGGHGAHVDAVDLFAAGVFEESGENGASDGIVGGQFDRFAAIGDDDAIVAVRRELGGEAAEFVAEGQVRLDDAPRSSRRCLAC